VVALILWRRLAESDFTVMSSVMHMDWSCWWCNYTDHVTSSSTALAFPTNMSEKCKSTSSSAIQVKNQQTQSVMKRNYLFPATFSREITNISHPIVFYTCRYLIVNVTTWWWRSTVAETCSCSINNNTFNKTFCVRRPVHTYTQKRN
jgi:hypothetical protein